VTPSKYLAEAEAELEDQFDAYDAADPNVAGRFLEAVDEAVGHIREFPRIGPPLARGYRKRLLRKPFRYKLVYKEHDGVLLIAAVWADRRDETLLFERLEKIDRGLGA
jgi:plasmid stabilization system protein ParE